MIHTSPQQIDAFKELINIGVARAAGSLNQMCGADIRLSVPKVIVAGADDLDELLDRGPGKMAVVRMGFSGDFRGSSDLVFPAGSAAKLVGILAGEEDSSELDALRAATLTEVGNIVLNGVLGSMANVLGSEAPYEVPAYIEVTSAELAANCRATDSALLLAQTHFFIGQSAFHICEEEITGEVTLLFGVVSFQALGRKIEELVRIPVA